jgi:hypothetical protein
MAGAVAAGQLAGARRKSAQCPAHHPPAAEPHLSARLQCSVCHLILGTARPTCGGAAQAHLTAERYYSVVANMRGASAEEVGARVLACPALGGLQGPTVSPVFTRSPGPGAAFAATICVPKSELYESIRGLRSVRRAAAAPVCRPPAHRALAARPPPQGELLACMQRRVALGAQRRRPGAAWPEERVVWACHAARTACHARQHRVKDDANAAPLRARQVGGSGVLVQPMTYIFDEEPKRWRALLNELGVPDYTPAQNGNGA